MWACQRLPAVLRQRDFRLLFGAHAVSVALSRVSSYDWFGSLAFQPLGLAIWGPVAAVIGIAASLWLAAALMAAATLALLSVPDIRRLPAAAPIP